MALLPAKRRFRLEKDAHYIATLSTSFLSVTLRRCPPNCATSIHMVSQTVAAQAGQVVAKAAKVSRASKVCDCHL